MKKRITAAMLAFSFAVSFIPFQMNAAAESVAFESTFDTPAERNEIFSVANQQPHNISFVQGLGGKSNDDYSMMMTANRSSADDNSASALNPAIEIPYYSFSPFKNDDGYVLEASVLYGGDVTAAKLDCFMNKTAPFSTGTRAQYSFIEIKDGYVYVLGENTGIECQKDAWIDFAIEEHVDISGLKIFINGVEIKTNLSGHSIFGNRWTQAKIVFDEKTVGTGYIALDNVKIYNGKYVPPFSNNGIELYVNGQQSNKYKNPGDVLSAKVNAYGTQNEEAMLVMAVYDGSGALNDVRIDKKHLNSATEFNTSYTLSRTGNINVKVFFWDAGTIKPYATFKTFEPDNSVPDRVNRFDAADTAGIYLSDKRAVQTYSNTIFYDGKKSKLQHNCINYDDEVLLPEDAFCKLFGKTLSVDGNRITVSDGTVLNVGSKILTKANTSTRPLSVPPEKHDGIVYIPSVAYGNAVLSKTEFIDDGHGMLVVGKNLAANDSKMKKANLYMFFERKTPEQLREQLISNVGDLTQHPRLMLNSGDVARLKSECITKSTRDPYKYSWYRRVKAEADTIVGLPVSTYYLKDGRLKNIATTAAYRLETVSFMYLLTNQNIYKEWALSELEAVTSFQDWGEQGSFLDTAAMATGAAIAYDWLYNSMTLEQRRHFAERIQALSVQPAIAAYTSGASYNDFWWDTETNWGIIANSGVAEAILATAEYNTGDMMFALNCALRSMESTWYRFAPDGAWYEGPGYWAYMMEYLSKFMACYKSAMGEDFAANYRGFNKYGYFQCYVMGPDGMPNNFHDTDLENIQSEGQFYFAKLYNDSNLMRYRRAQLEKYTGITPLVEDILWYDVSCSGDNSPAILDNVKYFRETELVSIRENWNDENSAWLSFHGGRMNTAHDHIDAGTFVYCIDGERWAIDVGKEPLRYANPNPAEDAGYTIQDYYRARAEGHNSVVINPSSSLGMNRDASAKVTEPCIKNGNIFSTVDLSSAYSEYATSYIRGFKMYNNLRTLIVRDEIMLKNTSPLYWFMHTQGEIKIVDNNTALITQNGKTLKVSVDMNVPHVLTSSPAESFTTSPKFTMTPNDGVTKLVLKSDNASGNVNITVKMAMLNEDDGKAVDTTAICDWQ